MAEGGIAAELRKIPVVSRTMLGLLAGTTLPTLLGIISPYQVVWLPQRILKRLELWRIITPFFFGGGGIQLLFDTIFFYRNTTALETQMFAQRKSDYIWTLVNLGLAIFITNYPLGSVVFWHAFLSGLTYLWSQIDPLAMVSLFGLPPFKAMYFPFALLALDLLQGGAGLALQSLSGLLAGYAVHYGIAIYPSTNGGRKPFFLRTPAFLEKLVGDQPTTGRGHGVRLGGGTVFPATRGFGGQAPVAPAGRPPADSNTANARHRWGSGNRLG